MAVYLRGAVWYVDYTDHRGMRVRRKVGKSKREAQTILSKLLADETFQKFFGYSAEGSKRIWDEMFLRLIGDGLGRIRPSTAKRYRVAQKSLSPFFGKTPISAITAEMISSYQQKRLEDGVAPATVNRSVGVLRAGLNLAKRYRWIVTVPSVRMLREPEAPTRFFSSEELQKIIHEVPHWMRPAVILAANTGIRLSELRELTWENVDLFAKTIFVTHTKTGFSRTVPLNQAARSALSGIVRFVGSPYVFNRKGRKWGSILQTFKRALGRAEVSMEYNWHSLRHTFASHLVGRGVELAVVRELLGHRPTSFRLTLRYAHLRPENHQDAVAKIEGLTEGSGVLFGAETSQKKIA